MKTVDFVDGAVAKVKDSPASDSASANDLNEVAHGKALPIEGFQYQKTMG